MSPVRADSTESVVIALLQLVHDQSIEAPEPTPFWRVGRWRCEFYRSAGTPRLRVYRAAVCVHEEFVPNQSEAERRSTELRCVYTRTGGPPRTSGFE